MSVRKPTREEISNAYKTLGLSEGASKEEIKRVYRDLSLKWHPDRFGFKGHLAKRKEEANEKFKEISNANDILNNKDNVDNANEDKYHDDYDKPSNTNSQNYSNHPEVLEHVRKKAKEVIQEALDRNGLTQTEFRSLLNELKASDVDYWANYSSRIDSINNADLIIDYLEKVLDAISICRNYKSDKNHSNEARNNFERVMRERDEWKWEGRQNNWEDLFKNNGNSYSSHDFNERYKKDFVNDIERRLKLKKISEDKLNKKLGVSDWRSEINKYPDMLDAQQEKFRIEDKIDALSREFVCAHCKQRRDDVWYPQELDGEKFCSYEHQSLWKSKHRKGNPIGGIIALTLLILMIVWLVKRRKNKVN
ncbi:MAG: Chaperone protein DnaJ [Mycoplasmataceae bacterium]|nr:MAG: Chaperone protein DnaJ [Mycoplasmataceae bacterium]